jgi:8-oxo-dGTP diphosphatase
MYDVRFKTWLEKGGRFILSEGRAELLSTVGKEGSLRSAATKLGISYRHAWEMLRKVGKAAGAPVVRSARGGKDKGASELTAAGKALLQAYDSGLRKLQRSSGPWLTADGIVEKGGQVLLVKRGRPPFEGRYALPGGFVESGETVEKAVTREVQEETGLRTRIARMAGVYSDPKRDPRGHTVTVVYVLEVLGGKLMGGDDAAEARFFPLDGLPPLAFDHDKVMKEYLARRR